MLRFFAIIFLIISSLSMNGCFLMLPYIDTEGGPSSSGSKSTRDRRASPHYVSYKTRSAYRPSNSAQSKDAIVNKLIRDLKSENLITRIYAASDLGRMGSKASSAVDPLILALRDQHKRVRRAAAKSLGDIGASAKRAIPALTRSTKDSDPWVAHSAKRAIQKIKAT